MKTYSVITLRCPVAEQEAFEKKLKDAGCTWHLRSGGTGWEYVQYQVTVLIDSTKLGEYKPM